MAENKKSFVLYSDKAKELKTWLKSIKGSLQDFLEFL